ncbi:MAG: hypothetical protein AAB281_04225, partial [Actinomycetota bacterium]
MPLTLGAVLTLFLAGGASGIGVYMRASTSTSGAQSNDESYTPAISGDGRYVAFQSYASSLVDGDGNSKADIFVKDTWTGATSLGSSDAAGDEGNGHSNYPAISGDGRYVAFQSYASNLVIGDGNSKLDIFVKDTQTGTTTRVSTSSAGAEGNGNSNEPSISADGSYVAFQSSSSNLVNGDTTGHTDIFVKNTKNGSTTRVSTDSAGNAAGAGSSGASISADGLYVAFDSTANNLVSGDNNNYSDIFIKYRPTGGISRVSIATTGAQASDHSINASISSNGDFVAFESSANDMVPGDLNGARDIFVRNRQIGHTTRVSTDAAGNEGNQMSLEPTISDDGRYVAFQSGASNLVGGDTGGNEDIFVKDRTSGATYRLSSGPGGEGNDHSSTPAISPLGGYVAFESYATNLIGNDSNGEVDIFLAPVNHNRYYHTWYDYGGATTGLFLFDPMAGFAPGQVWFSGAGNWDWGRTMTTMADKIDDDLPELYAFYNYGGATAGLFVFDPVKGYVPWLKWNSCAGCWDFSRTKTVTTADQLGREVSEVITMYNYGGENTGMFKFNDDGSDTRVYISGPGNWDFSRSKVLTAANYDNDATTEIAVLYDYGNANTGIFVFDP